uniref:Uncharacterized protein n=1 Tax=Streptomyces graminearus TaxID=284030 RepID=K4HWD5_9ACTN|nr:hypothetical protein [Streptomyces graminearus]
MTVHQTAPLTTESCRVGSGQSPQPVGGRQPGCVCHGCGAGAWTVTTSASRRSPPERGRVGRVSPHTVTGPAPLRSPWREPHAASSRPAVATARRVGPRARPRPSTTASRSPRPRSSNWGMRPECSTAGGC